MNKKNMIALSLAVSLFLLYSCSKTNENFEAQGGLLPTNYIILNESSFSPAALTVATGSSVTFVNKSNSVHTIVSDDSVTIFTNTIQPNSSFFYKKDTIGTFSYHCATHPTVKGTIIFNP